MRLKIDNYLAQNCSLSVVYFGCTQNDNTIELTLRTD